MSTPKIREDFARAHGLLLNGQQMWDRLDREITKTFNFCNGYPHSPKVAIVHSGYLEAVRYGNLKGYNVYNPHIQVINDIFKEQIDLSNDAGHAVNMDMDDPDKYQLVRKAFAICDYNLDDFLCEWAARQERKANASWATGQDFADKILRRHNDY